MRIAVAMSGGIDSTAAALLLKNEGHEIVGLHMRLHSASNSSWLQARQAAEQLGTVIHAVDLSREFCQYVIEPFLDQYLKGLTPSPCPQCNRRIKFGLLYQRARALGCDMLATGHYARIAGSGTRLLKGIDTSKDQSYFLFNLPEAALGTILFPLGDYAKADVRNMLRKEGIAAAHSEESQELCFIPGGNYRLFLREKGIAEKPGNVLNTKGEFLGRHSGITHFTVGQRRGLGICAPRPLYVIRIDPATNSVIVGFREETLRQKLWIGNLNMFPLRRLSRGARFQVKVRSTSRPVWCSISEMHGDRLELTLDCPQSGIAPGQAAVLYLEDELVGGGWIQATGSSQA
jgi:tRNA-specific 2-thiouridylase